MKQVEERELNFPEWDGHILPSPTLTFDEFDAWVRTVIIPAKIERGEWTEEKLREDCLRNEGSMEPFKL